MQANASAMIGKQVKRCCGIVGALLRPVLRQWLPGRARPADEGCGAGSCRPVQEGPRWCWQCELAVKENTQSSKRSQAQRGQSVYVVEAKASPTCRLGAVDIVLNLQLDTDDGR